MLLPNANRVVVPDAKIRDYLLSSVHPIGRFKAAFFVGLGFSQDRWELLRNALVAAGNAGDAIPGQQSAFGQKFEVRATLTGPSGRTAEVITVWVVPTGQDVPHFVTVFPA